MMELHEVLNKLFTEVDHLDRILPDEEPTHGESVLALASAKKVRSLSTLLVRALAERRDSATAQEGTSND